MPTVEDVLVNNFKETITRHDRWVVAGILGAVFVLLVTIGELRARTSTGEPRATNAVSLPFGLPAAEPGVAAVLALTLTVAAGPAVFFYWLRMRSIATRLRNTSPDLFAAAMTFPSLMTVEESLVKSIVLTVPPTIVLVSGYIEDQSPSLAAIAGWVLLFLPWVLAVGLAMRPLPKVS